MVLTQPHSILDADLSPLALLRVRRAEADVELRKSLITASFMALTLIVAFTIGQLVLHAGPQKKMIEVPIIDYPPIDVEKYDPISEGVLVPPVKVSTDGVIIPVKDEDVPPDVPVIEPTQTTGTISDNTNPGPITMGNRTGTGGQKALPDPDPNAPVFVEKFPEVVTKVVPVYPPIAKDAGMEGQVLVRMLVGIDGRVKKAEIQTSSPMFDEYALAAARQWIFTPATSNGNPVPVWVRVPMKFQLH
jgi:protein TonB